MLLNERALIKTRTFITTQVKNHYLLSFMPVSFPTDIKELTQKNSEMRERTICILCCEERVSIVFLPCGHLVSCAQCSPALKNCPVCRESIKGTVRVSFA